MNRYITSNVIVDPNEKRRVSTVIMSAPTNPDDIYIQTTTVERLDLLADKFYGDITMWWIIAAANGIGKGSLYVPANTIIRVPAAASAQKYLEMINTTR
jgi:hypothetical protein